MTDPAIVPSDSARYRHRVDVRWVDAVRPFARALRFVHPVRCEGAHHVPAGAALLVGNHGLVGYETLMFFDLLQETLGRLPIGLADRWFFRIPGVRSVLVRIGGTYGSPENGLRALADGELVVCYPGGAREVLKRTHAARYRLRWETSLGFARLAIRAQVPIVPFAAAGVDDTYRVVTTLPGTGELLMGHPKYDLPVLWGIGPLPRPVPFWFRLGAPVAPGFGPEAADDEESVRTLHERVRIATQSLLDGLVEEWRRAYGTKAVGVDALPAE